MEALVAVAAFVFLAVVQWHPFGLRTTGLIEEWSFYSGFDSRWTGYFVAFARFQPSRPLHPLAWFLGYRLDPDSFLGLNVVIAATFVAKALLLWAVLRRGCGVRSEVAFLAGALFALHPAPDAALFNPRAAGYNLVAVCYLAAAGFLASFWRNASLLSLTGFCIAQALCLLQYEVAFPLMFATPFLMFGIRPALTKRPRWMLWSWYVVPLVLFAWFVRVVASGTVYQSGLLRAGRVASGEWPREYAYHLGRAYWHALVGSWIPAFRRLLRLDEYTAASVLVGLVFGSLVFFFRFRSSGSAHRDIRVLAAGLAVLGLGFLPFLPIPHRTGNFQAFVFSSAGAALVAACLTGALTWIPRGGPLLTGGAAGLLAAAAFANASHHHRSVVLESHRHQRVLARIVAQAPAPARGSLLIVFDEPGDLLKDPMFGLNVGNLCLAEAVHYLYRDFSLQVAVCDAAGVRSVVEAERCEFGPRAVGLIRRNGYYGWYPYDKVIAFAYAAPDGLELMTHLPVAGTTGYDPLRRIDTQAAPPDRFYTVIETPFQALVPPNVPGPRLLE